MYNLCPLYSWCMWGISICSQFLSIWYILLINVCLGGNVWVLSAHLSNPCLRLRIILVSSTSWFFPLRFPFKCIFPALLTTEMVHIWRINLGCCCFMAVNLFCVLLKLVLYFPVLFSSKTRLVFIFDDPLDYR